MLSVFCNVTPCISSSLCCFTAVLSACQVRDVLKGVLKPTCLSDTESEVAGYSWMNAALGSGGVKRQLSESSAHRSLLVVVVGVVDTCSSGGSSSSSSSISSKL